MVRFGAYLTSGKKRLNCQGLQLSSVALNHLRCPRRQPGEESIRLRKHFGIGPKTGTGGNFFAHSFPDGLIGIEIQTISR
jgi:hypothetical protein